ncbi:Vegetative incompatibility HET-E-1-like protein [Cladobotryum mycophilum]|uniref:Vegetative incompatibility HET-E-1-like protein n=1 Tax=Cladobotryum mycophilum TaxID=491253 RepID=A0ABR0SIB0_9HYPO
MDRIHVHVLLGLAIVTYLWLAARRLRWSTKGQSWIGEKDAERSQPNEDEVRARPPIEILYAGDDMAMDVEVDIIAVHGLGSRVDWSWVWKDETRNVNWLRDRDMLPSLVPKARIMAYNYDSKWHKDAPKTRIELCGEELMRTIHNRYRQENIRRPIIFIGHSLGGNVIINGLVHANSEPEWCYLSNMTVGLIFLGSPFRGTKSQYLIDIAARIMAPMDSHRGIVKELDYDNETLRSTLNRFCRLRNRLSISVSCFFELYASDYGKRGGINGIKGMIVDEASASIPGLTNIALQADHFKINKFSSPEDRSYKLVSTEIQEMFANARDTVQHRERPKTMITDRNYILGEYPNCSVVLNDLFLTDPLEDKNALKRKKGARAEGTCEWIMGTEAITKWLQGGMTGEEYAISNILWLYASPGMGKSTMSIFLAEELSKIFTSTPSRTAAYFFCDSNFSERRKVTSILRGLLLQFVQQHPILMINYLLPKYNERGARLFESFDALWALFLAMGQDKSTGRKYCIIDALDECDRDAQETLLKQMRQTFRQKDAHNYSNIHILITSRPYSDIKRHFKNTSFVQKDLASFSEIQRDVDLFIREKIDHLSAMNGYTKSIEQRASEILKERSEGTFLWIGLACTELEQIPSKNTIKFLQQLPSELHSLYRNLIGTAIEANRSEEDVIRRILTFVAVAMRPLTVLELSEACNLHENQEKEERSQFMQDDIALCRLLVVIDGEKVLLLHKSVQDFLQSQSGLSMNGLEMHATLAYRCLDQLIADFHHNQQASSISKRISFSSYSESNWMDHAHLAMSEFKVQDSHLEFFCFDSESRLQWIRRQSTRGLGAKHSILHIAGHYGIPSLVDYAFSATNPDFVRFPLPFDDSSYLSEISKSPLEEAAECGNVEAIRRLLCYADKNMGPRRRVLQAALWSRKRQTEMIRLFLEHFGDHIIDEEFLISAAFMGGEMFELLLNRVPNQAFITDKVVATAAAHRISTIKLVLKRLGDLLPITVLVVEEAAENKNGGDEVMSLLLAQVTRLPITERAMSKAAQNVKCGAKILQVFLEKQGDQVSITEDVIYGAVSVSNIEFLTILFIKRPCQALISDRIVVKAVFREHLEVLELLLEHRGEFRLTEEMVFEIARSERMGAQILRLFLNRGETYIPVTEKSLLTLSDYANTEVLQLFLRQNIELPITGRVISRAAKTGHTGLMGMILDAKGDQVHVPFEAVVGAAAEGRNFDMALRLLHEMKNNPPVSRDILEERLKCGDILEDLWEDDDPADYLQDFIVNDEC